MRAGRHPLIRKLEHFERFSDGERDALLEATADVRTVGPREELIREGEIPGGVVLVLTGFATRHKSLPDGRRQFLGFLVPGDFCNYRNYLLARMDHSVGTLTEASVAVLSKETVDRLTQGSARIDRCFAWAQLLGEAIAREWIVNVGQRTATERAAHLFCEMFHRQRAVGWTVDWSCELPFTQMELGDTLGLSAVHVNRTLQELRRQGLITLKGGELTILDLPALEALAMFDPHYLHLGADGGAAGTGPAGSA
jgi:CRP-like cAMP-binding protein